MFQGNARPRGAIQAVHSGDFWQLEDEKGVLHFEATPVRLPSLFWCETIIKEWQPAKKNTGFPIKPDRPATQVAQLALLGTAVHPKQYHQQLLEYLPTDTLLFWQQYPAGLMQAQEQHWQPILDWLKERFGDCPEKSFTLNPAEIPVSFYESLQDWLQETNPYCLAGLIFLSGITGSVLLSTALTSGFVDAEQAYLAACLEALYQREHWGADSEGDARLDRIRKSCILAMNFLQI